MGGRLDPGRVWALARDGETVGSGRVGRVRLLPFAFALLLGAAPASGCTLSGLPVAFALARAKADEREVLLGMLTPTRIWWPPTRIRS